MGMAARQRRFDIRVFLLFQWLYAVQYRHSPAYRYGYLKAERGGGGGWALLDTRTGGLDPGWCFGSDRF